MAEDLFDARGSNGFATNTTAILPRDFCRRDESCNRGISLSDFMNFSNQRIASMGLGCLVSVDDIPYCAFGATFSVSKVRRGAARSRAIPWNLRSAGKMAHRFHKPSSLLVGNILFHA